MHASLASRRTVDRPSAAQAYLARRNRLTNVTKVSSGGRAIPLIVLPGRFQNVYTSVTSLLLSLALVTTTHGSFDSRSH
jgi:hypothetical protein